MPQVSGRFRVDVVKEDRLTLVGLSGPLDETAHLVEIAGLVEPPLAIDLGSLTLINSTGVRDWIQFLKLVTPRGAVTLRHCPMFMVNQFNLLRSAVAGATVESFEAPYSCGSCNAEAMKELVTARHLPEGRRSNPPALACECGGILRFDDFPETYFLFLGA